MSGERPARVPRLGGTAAVLAEDSSSCAMALGLQHVLHSIMSYLPLSDRLGQAALVCQQWSTVATQATADEGIDESLNSDDWEQESTMEPWIEKHGHNLPSIKLHAAPMFRAPKPFMSALTRLTSLELCCLQMSPEALSCLAASLKDLRIMTLRHLYARGYDDDLRENVDSPYVKAWQQVWKGCPQLTYIELERFGMQDKSLKGLSTLQHLKKLVLLDNPLHTASYLTPLPRGLTGLIIWGLVDNHRVDIGAALSQHPSHAGPGYLTPSSTASAPGSALVSLHVNHAQLSKPSVLSSLTSLTSLHVPDLHSSKPRELLDVLASLSKLRSLDLSPEDVLQRLEIGHSDFAHSPNPILGTADLERLVSACPDLEWLSVAVLPRPTPGADLSVFDLMNRVPLDAQTEPFSLLALQGAKRLASLTVRVNQRLLDSHLAELATLTTLQSLDVMHAGPSITDVGVQELTRLTILTWLRVSASSDASISTEVVPANGITGSKYLHITTCTDDDVAEQAGPDLSVSQQLASRCARSPLLHPP